MRAISGYLLLGLTLADTAVLSGELSTRELADARKVYVAKCAKCHRFYEPTNYADAEWQRWMEKMNRKSKLGPEQAELLGRYLDAYRAGRLRGKPEAKP